MSRTARFLNGNVMVCALIVGAGVLATIQATDGKKTGNPTLFVDVILDEVDLKSHTISATSTIIVVPPYDNVGGQMFVTGTTGSHRDKAAKLVRLPVMPEARIQDKKPKAGLHAILQLEMLDPGCLAVVGIEEFQGLERIGIQSLDAPGAKGKQ